MISKNIRRLDRYLRIAVGLALDMWFFSGTLQGPLTWIVGFVCVYLLTSGALSYCPIYGAFAWRGKQHASKSGRSRASLF